MSRCQNDPKLPYFTQIKQTKKQLFVNPLPPPMMAEAGDKTVPGATA